MASPRSFRSFGPLLAAWGNETNEPTFRYSALVRGDRRRRTGETTSIGLAAGLMRLAALRRR